MKKLSLPEPLTLRLGIKTTNYRAMTILQKLGSSVLVALVACLLISENCSADLLLTFDGDGDNDVQTGIITVDLDAATASLPGGIGDPSVTGSLDGLSGSFAIEFFALGTIADTFDENDFSGGAAVGVFTTATEWAVNSDINTLANTFPGQGIVFDFDFSGVTGDVSNLALNGVRWQNTVDGSRLSFRDEGSGTSAAIYAGGGAIGSDASASFTQLIDTDDQVAFWATGTGQRRLKEFSFSNVVVPEPSSLIFLNLTGLGLVLCVRRRNRV